MNDKKQDALCHLEQTLAQNPRMEQLEKKIAEQDAQRQKSEVELFAQEHRLLAAAKRWWNIDEYKGKSAHRRAILWAFWARVFWTFIPAAAAGSIGFLSIYSAYLAYQANSLVAEQNQRFADQNQLVLEQFRSNKLTEITKHLYDHAEDSKSKFNSIILDSKIPMACQHYYHLNPKPKFNSRIRQDSCNAYIDLFPNEKVDFSRAKLSDVQIIQKDLRSADFRESNLADTRFKGCALNGAIFTDANLSTSMFRGGFVDCDLRQTIFKRAILLGTDFERCDLRGARFERDAFTEFKMLGGEKQTGIPFEVIDAVYNPLVSIKELMELDVSDLLDEKNKFKKHEYKSRIKKFHANLHDKLMNPQSPRSMGLFMSCDFRGTSVDVFFLKHLLMTATNGVHRKDGANVGLSFCDVWQWRRYQNYRGTFYSISLRPGFEFRESKSLLEIKKRNKVTLEGIEEYNVKRYKIHYSEE